MIICPNCGHRNADNARYCASCRVNLGDAAPKDEQGRPQYDAISRRRRTIWGRIKRLLSR